ncbi:MAG: hypothetical protein QOJ16_3496, partial [Acidobacteriota bacterium]|nr:hypothetical protein [Acidobacteriota bacterium]
GRVRQVTLDALAHQDLPFEMLVEHLAPERDAGRSPLFQVMFAHQDLSLSALALPGLRSRPLAVDLGMAKFDLTLYLEEAGGVSALALEYDRELFDDVTVHRLGAQLERLLTGMAAAPEGLLSALPLLGDAERQQLLREWNDTGSAPASGACLHQLFEAQAERTPTARAVAFAGESLTYCELDRRAGRLARRLRGLGVGPEVLVGLCIERTLEMAVGVLAILKAGGAYLPLDPAYPAARTDGMLEDSGVRVLLTQERWRERFAGRTDLLCLTVDGEPDPPSAEGDLPAAGPGNLAYIIYTSGSTGRPKGVAIEHRSAAALVAWARRVYGPEDLDGVLAATSLCFDLSVFELFLPWSTGGTVLLEENALALPAVAARERVTLLNTVPSAVAALLKENALPASLRTVNLAGEPLLPSLVAEIYRSASGVERVFDLYGPTEDTTYSTFALRRHGGPATIGRPIAGTRVLLLDRACHPVPLGAPGELCLAGAGLTRGYLNRPGATAERFIPDPFAAHPGERLYRTGDLARQRPDGTLELLGRADRQVKVRGFRVEPGEVEAALSRHPGVESAVVVAGREAAGGLRLVAYWVPAGRRSNLDSRELRSFLKESLPDPMLPAVFVRIESLPLLPNGKVDRAALPAAPRELEGEAAMASPRPPSPIAEILAGIWAEVLGLSRVGPEDNFFELGGHSLLAAQVVSRVREALGVDIGVRALFDSPTPAALAIRVAAAADRVALPPLAPRSGEPELSFAQARLWFLDRLEPGGASYNMPTAMRLSGELDVPALARALAESVRRHETLRSTFPALGGRPRLVIREDDRPAFSQIDLSGLPEPRREMEALSLATAEARAPFDLARGPLLRGRLLRLAGTEHAVLLTLHHIVADGWSLGVLVGEMGALYAAFAADAPPPLSDLPIQYSDFAAWQRQTLSGEALAVLLGYWREQLAGVAALQLPADRPRLPRRARRGGLVPVALSRRLSEDLALLARRRGMTLFMALLAGFQAVLARYAGQADVVVGSPVAGRSRPEVEGLIGLFVNTLALRTDLAGDPPVSLLLERVREVALGAYSHQELPFEMLVEELSPERDTGRPPLFQVMFVLQNTPRPRLDLPGLVLHPIEVGTGAAKFDLTLFLEEGSGGLTGGLEFDEDLFEGTTARRLLTHLEILLGQVVAAPETPLSGLPLLSAGERHQLLAEWDDTATAGPPAAGFLDLFAAQVRRAPEAEAVVCEGERLSYGELALRVDRLARVLAGMGVGPEVRVGICLEPSLDLVVGLLGILRAGGAYVPLDPAYPRERLDWMIEDSRVAVILTQERMDAFTPAPADESGLSVQVAPENLAYVIYTSGSTGRPKGVMVSHGALAHYLRWCLKAYGLDRGAGAPLHSSIGFDLTVTSLFPPLLAGRAVTLVPERLGIEALGRALRAPAAGAGFSLVKITPAHLELLNRQLPGAAKAGKTGVLILGGEALWAESLAAWHADAPGTRLINEYGPTEATVGCCVHEIPTGGPAAGAVPIGRPIADTRLYLLDEGLRPVPVGVPGELYIGGAGLARGYLDLPGQTAARFVPDPCGGERGGRLYRSGDLARYLPDGRLEYLGRADHQVKVRGFRIEPGEIEAVLVQHPGVREAVVVGRHGGPGDLRLVAYWVPGQEATGAPSPGELKRFLAGRLPAYMLPATLVRLAALPLTAHGKVDRDALPVPDAARPELESAYTAPVSPAERRIAEVWQRVLRLEKVGIDDNFFDAGGHSLLMVEVQAQLQEVLATEIDLVALFEHATVRSLAAHLRGGDSAPSLSHVHERAERQQRAAERKRLARGGRRLGT